METMSKIIYNFREGMRMSILVRFSPPSMTAEQYDTILERLYKEGIHPDPGLRIKIYVLDQVIKCSFFAF